MKQAPGPPIIPYLTPTYRHSKELPETMVRESRADLEAAKERKNRESLLETLESIVVAFILAFIFRAFIVEAFVIPTGSMAPTLYGAHYEFHCPSCGYDFAAGEDVMMRSRPGNQYMPSWACPNCFYPSTLAASDHSYSGDRILVLKFLYEFQPPQRWDVFVFRNPNEPSQNYIKRLAGLPGEKLEIHHGDVTINGRIVQKTDKAQEALWMIVHDTRYVPHYPAWRPRWTRDAGWQEDKGGKGFRLDKADAKTAWLTYEHRVLLGKVDNEMSEKPSNILDFYAYNSAGVMRAESNVVTDLCLRGKVKAESPAAGVTIELSAYKDRFRFDLPAKGAGRPARVLHNGTPVEEVPDGVLPVGRAVEVLAANVDHKLMLWIDGRRVAKGLTPDLTPEGDPIYEPTPITTMERITFDEQVGKPSVVRLGAAGGPVTVEYLRLDRDVFYTNQCGGDPANGTEGSPIQLAEGEYFALGDNSPNSSDSRFWHLKRPVVPEKNLVGKAFFVYWPSAGMRYWIPVAPDATGWRFVH